MCKKTVAFATLGCKVNMYDTQAMRELFLSRGYTEVSFDETADVYLINTCSVTNLGDKKSRQLIRRAVKLNPDAVIIAAGCYAQVAPLKVAAIEGVGIIAGTANRAQIVDLAEKYKGGILNAVTDIRAAGEFEPLSVDRLEGHTRAYIKIQDGCNRFCTYCIIPYARGPIRSRAEEDVIDEVRRLASSGFKEIVLTGIHIASYGIDTYGRSRLADITEQVHSVEGIERIRFSSMEPLAVTDGFISRMRALDKVCGHFHLSLQSGCDRTLREMGRRYTSQEYYEAVCRIREAYPDGAVTTDIIVGFPGEKEEDFLQSLAFVEKCALAKLHVFPYSPKEGTPAARRSDMIPPDVKAKRAEEMARAGARLQGRFLGAMVGRELEVLFERECSDGLFEGYTRNYARVTAPSAVNLHNTLKKVKITALDEENMTLCGEIKE